MPSCAAARFMSSAKPSTEPPIPSATVIATSLAERTISILSAFSSVTCVPTAKPIFEGGILCARADTTSGVFSAI